jgi:putative aminopeptidase FrvX
MKDELLHRLQELTSLPGISGHEQAMTEFLHTYFQARWAQVTVDRLGNVAGTYGSGKPHLAILAHMDTVGMKVKRNISDTLLQALPVGGVNYKALPGTRVLVGDQPGIVTIRSQHLSGSNDALMNEQNIWIQTANADQIMPTTPIHYQSQPILMGDLYSDCGLDDRAGCAILCLLADELATNDCPAQVTLIGTVQEETTCLGAVNILRELQPDFAIFVDGTLSYELPEFRSQGSVIPGKGAVFVDHLYVSGLNGWHADPDLNRFLIEIARRSELPYQQDAIRGLMSDARSATQNGIPSALIGIPMSGKHSASETIHLRDMMGILSILKTAIQTITDLPDKKIG